MEQDWDWVIVEARDVTDDPNSDDWTTLPEADTDGAGTADTEHDQPEHRRLLPGGAGGAGPPAARPLLDGQPGRHPDGCDPTGSTGEWNAFTGSSGGWTDWTVDLSGYAGSKVELRISAVTDWGTLGLGAWVDDWRLTDGATQIEFQDFEQPLDDSWLVGPPPEGTPPRTAGRSAARSSSRAASWPPRTRSTPGSGSRASTRRAERVHGPHAHAPRRRHQPAAAGRRGAPAGGGGSTTTQSGSTDDTKAGAQAAKGRAYAKLKGTA